MSLIHRSLSAILLTAAIACSTGCSRREAAPDAPPPPAGGKGPVVTMPEMSPDTPVVTVNTQVLTRAEADRQVAQMMRSQGVPEEQLPQLLAGMGSQLRQRIADQFVARTLLQEEARRRNIRVSDDAVAEVISNLTARLPPGKSVEQALADSNLSMAELREEVRGSEMVEELYKSETERVPEATEADAATFYAENSALFETGEEVTARHILIKADASATEEQKAAAKARIEDLRRQLLAGGDFAKLAAEHSACPSGKDGGNLGSFGRGTMAPEFEAAAFSQPTNVVGEVVQTSFGYHVIEVTGRSAAGKRPLESVSPAIRKRMTDESRREAFESFIDGLRTNATIVYAEAPADEAAPDQAE